MTQAERVIGRFGGLTALARAMGKGISTVQGWQERGYIPSRHHSAVLAAGANLQPPLAQREFFSDGKPTPDGSRCLFLQINQEVTPDQAARIFAILEEKP